MADLYMKTGDMGPSAVLTLVDADQQPVDLTTASSIKVTMVRATTNREPRFQDRSCSILQTGTDPNFVNKGKVRYDWQTGDTGAPGDYLLEAEAVFAAKEQTHPDKGYLSVRIDPSIG